VLQRNNEEQVRTVYQVGGSHKIQNQQRTSQKYRTEKATVYIRKETQSKENNCRSFVAKCPSSIKFKKDIVVNRKSDRNIYRQLTMRKMRGFSSVESDKSKVKYPNIPTSILHK
jgi:hypothetical protein